VRLAAIPALAVFAVIGGAGVASCSIGTGEGSVTGTLDVPDCWSGPFNLQPTFFGAVPYDNTLELRIQNGGDYETFSDGVQILIDSLSAIRGSSTQASLYGQALTVSLPVGVSPPGVPLSGNPDPSIVHLTLYLQRTCPTQSVALYAMESVSLNAAGGCDARDAGAAQITCPGSGVGLADAGATGDAGGVADAGAVADASASVSGEAGAAAPSVGHSTITFSSLFDGNPNEVSADLRLNQGTFQVYLADPREGCPGGGGPPPPCRGMLTGNFKFYFERGKPAQPFP
jgi:hypothetical protein